MKTTTDDETGQTIEGACACYIVLNDKGTVHEFASFANLQAWVSKQAS